MALFKLIYDFKIYSIFEIMMFKQISCFVLVVVLELIAIQLISQERKYSPSKIEYPVYFHKTLPLREMKIIIPPTDTSSHVETIHHFDNNPWIVNYSNLKNLSIDLALQYTQGTEKSGTIIENFKGMDNIQYKIPPDTDGDVGTNHYIQMINMSFAIFNKKGTIVYGPASNLSIWQEAPAPWSNTSNGDPIVLFDEVAHRWMISELSFPNHPYGPYYMKIAISATEDPTDSWYLYGYEYEYFCDYPKLGIWHDGYYLTNNNNFWDGSQWDFHAVGVSVFERDSMLIGSPEARRIFFDFYPNTIPWSVLPTDFDGTPPSSITPAYLACYKEGTSDWIFIYKVVTNWQDIYSSSMFLMNSLLPSPFTGNIPNGITQPDNAPYLSSMSNRLMYRLQYRNFEDYECMVANHTVNRGDGIAGIRWYEFRNNGTGWEIYQQGTYSPDNNHRWMGSIAMDGYGNIALGYSVSSDQTYPSIRYTGRSHDAPLGVMNEAEKIIIDGSGVQTNPYHRWGDYSCMSVDPTDQTTFWYTQEYYETTGDRSWDTRIASFNINDFLTLDLSYSNETVCEGDSIQLFASPNGGSEIYSYLWSSNPPLPETTDQNPIFIPQVTTTFFCTVHDGVNSVLNKVLIQVIPSPEVYSGHDTTLIAGEPLVLFEATASDYEMLEWSTNGNGYFDDPYFLNPTYYSGIADIGIIELMLNVQGYYPCGNFTSILNLEVLPPNIQLDIKVFLEGPYNGNGMDNGLFINLPLSQPYNVEPWNYEGDETVDSIPSPEVVDWVLIELRDAASAIVATSETVIARQAAFLLNNGKIRALDALGFQEFNNVYVQQSLFVVIAHRNHVSIMSANPLTESGGIYSYDFTMDDSQAYGTAAQIELGGGIFGMISGDGDASGEILLPDKDHVWELQTGQPGYLESDYDLNSEVNNQDKDDYWLPNLGKGTFVPD
ncbi:MAG: hypothetical protein R2750_08050 [Bacteroidales bacterium]